MALSFGIIAVMAWLRLVAYPQQDQPFPLSPAVPLLLCLWTRDVRSLYGMSVAFTMIALLRIFWVTKGATSGSYETLLIVSQFTNIWLVAGVIHGILAARNRIERKNDELGQLSVELEASNEELASSNEELAVREEEIMRQNEELQSSTEELEQQSEELRQRAEEMEQQSVELNDANNELLRRERGLQTLLDSGRWLRADLSESLVMNGICQAGVQVLGDDVNAAAVLVESEGKLALNGNSGFGLQGALAPEVGFDESFAALLLESGKTAAIEDIEVRPDIQLPRPGAGRPFRSVLGSPIWHEGRPVAALEIYSTAPRQWSEHDFRIAEWLAGQAALAIQAIRFQQEIEQKRRAAEEASIQKTRFLAAISHDVRTPANAISLLAELIGRCAKDPERAHQVPALATSLWNNSRAMIELVSDVLDLTRFDSGRLDLDLSEFSLSEVIRLEVQQALPIAQGRGLALREVLPEQELRLNSDKTKLARVLSNFISNAVKFTEAGEIRVELAQEEGGWVVHVIDSGIGIPSEHLGSIFDEFFQLRNPERNREKGTGLGLAICRRLIDALGFRVSVKSLVGIGTTFSVHVPAGCVADGAAVREAPVDGREYSLKDARILLVEDHQVAREATAQLLEAEGAQVATAETGREAVRKLAAGSYDILLLDLNLPDFEGTEILRALQVSKPESLRCVLVVTGDVRPERIAEVKALGAHDLLAKPVSVERIRKALGGC
ncbi:ATP-binding protein [Luteolibacter sp. Populi]|uniref:hybrid sensor histidine kinase/response regulator n=1 Tax=Luteolibacter sp. Populi TaxID=3230487 RepID=UPI003465D27F